MIGDTKEELAYRIAAAMDITDFLDLCDMSVEEAIAILIEEVDEETIARLDRACR